MGDHSWRRPGALFCGQISSVVPGAFAAAPGAPVGRVAKDRGKDGVLVSQSDISARST